MCTIFKNIRSTIINLENLYLYRATVLSVYDGDSVRVDWDLGAGIIKTNEALRLARINAPEVRGDGKIRGKLARDWLRERIVGKEIYIRTMRDKKGKYGRYIAEVYLNGVNINDELVSLGYAVYREY